jgi:chromosome segregation ATPase
MTSLGSSSTYGNTANNNTNNTNNNNNTEAPKAELTSILSQVQNLQTDREKLMKELEVAKQKVEKLTEGKRAEMKNALDTVVARWLEDSVENETVRSQFKEGMERLVKQTAEDSGVWQVAVCASAAHAKKINEIERLRAEHEELKTRVNGEFGNETSRKRGREETKEGGPATDEPVDFWAGFEESFKTKGYELQI